MLKELGFVSSSRDVVENEIGKESLFSYEVRVGSEILESGLSRELVSSKNEVKCCCESIILKSEIVQRDVKIWNLYVSSS